MLLNSILPFVMSISFNGLFLSFIFVDQSKTMTKRNTNIRWRSFHLAIVFPMLMITSCTYDKETLPLDESCYPEKIAKIIIGKCAVAGCHNTQSNAGAGGFNLSSWEHLFEGGRNGSSVIPYSPDQSFLMYFINTYTDIGTVFLSPTMPVNGQPLSHEEVTEVRNWIKSGAPDCNGKVKFCCDPLRKKFYVCYQNVDIVTVFDLQTRRPMRIIEVGENPQPQQIESAHDIDVAPDGNYWYVNFFSGQVLQKFNTSDDQLVGQVNIGPGQWSTLTISRDSKYGFVVNFSFGTVAFVDLEQMVLLATYSGLNSPHGCAVSDDFKTLYVTAQTGNYIYKFDYTNDPSHLNPDVSQVVLGPGPPVFSSLLDPHQIVLSPDQTKYYVSCQRSNEVRVMSVAADTLLAVIQTGHQPQEMEMSLSRPYLFVSCMNDSSHFPGTYGSMDVINYQSDQFITAVFSGWQPHGFDVDDDAGLVYVANRNANPAGPAQHHNTGAGRNGYITIIDMNTLNLIPGYKVEVGINPYEISVRN